MHNNANRINYITLHFRAIFKLTVALYFIKIMIIITFYFVHSHRSKDEYWFSFVCFIFLLTSCNIWLSFNFNKICIFELIWDIKKSTTFKWNVCEQNVKRDSFVCFHFSFFRNEIVRFKQRVNLSCNSKRAVAISDLVVIVFSRLDYMQCFSRTLNMLVNLGTVWFGKL